MCRPGQFRGGRRFWAVIPVARNVWHPTAPAGSGLVVFDLEATIALPPGDDCPLPSSSVMGTVAVSPTLRPGGNLCPPPYRRRHPRATSLYQLLDVHYETVKGVWEERFERRYGFWRGLYDAAVAKYLDCGLFESGFARVKCTRCPAEFLVAFSCKGRGLCPSCGAKRAAIFPGGASFGGNSGTSDSFEGAPSGRFSALLQNKILADVPHAQWVFSIPKMLRLYFLHHRELLGELAGLAYETIREMMAAVIEEPHARPGMVAVIQTFGSSLKWNPHIHAIVTRGVFLDDGSWQPIPYVDSHKAELVFRHKVLRFLRDRELIGDVPPDVEFGVAAAPWPA